jgi:Tol biopolymer transport system component
MRPAHGPARPGGRWPGDSRIPRTARWTGRWTRRRLLGTAAAALGTALRASSATGVRAADAPGGWIALPRGREIALVRPDGSEDRTVVTLEQGEFAADVALSPDGTRLAFGLFTARTGEGAGGSDIVIAPVDGGTDRTVVVPRDRPGMLLASPSWSPDAKALVFEAVGLSGTGQPIIRSDWVAVDGGGRRTIATSARYPSFSPDGQAVVYTRTLPAGDALWEQPVAGGAGRELVADSLFLMIAYPRYGPDGKLIAFAGVGDAVPGLSGMPKLLGDGPAADPTRPRAALAHGFPAEPFAVTGAGADPRRLAQLPIDDAAVAWSPDGYWLAISGANGLFVVGVADGSVRRVTENGSFGGIDWR